MPPLYDGETTTGRRNPPVGWKSNGGFCVFERKAKPEASATPAAQLLVGGGRCRIDKATALPHLLTQIAATVDALWWRSRGSSSQAMST